MKAILEFNLNEDDNIEFEYAIRGTDLAAILWDFDQELRRRYKYGSESDMTMDVDKVRELLRETMDEYGINFENKMFS
jgi:hypothetical protein